MKKLAKFPSNVWKTHKMQQLGQKWGSKSYLDPKKMRLPDLAKRDFLLIFAHFSTLSPQKWPKIKKLAKFPSNVWKTHEMQQHGQKWGSKSYLGPNLKVLPKYAIAITKNPKMYRILQNFGERANFATTLNNLPASSYDSVKSYTESTTYVIRIFKMARNVKRKLF